MNVRFHATARLEGKNAKVKLHGVAVYWVDKKGKERTAATSIECSGPEVEKIGKLLAELVEKKKKAFLTEVEMIGFEAYKAARVRREIVLEG